jgi:hypothetical protein
MLRVNAANGDEIWAKFKRLTNLGEGSLGEDTASSRAVSIKLINNGWRPVAEG